MTPATLIGRMWTTQRGVGALLVLLLLVGALLFQTWAGIAAQRSIILQYGAQVIKPEDDTLCPGDTLHYSARVPVRDGEVPFSLYIVEGWWSESLQTLLRPTVIQEITHPRGERVTETRTVPYVSPGIYWYDHIANNGEYDSYTVGPITILGRNSCGE